MWSTPPQGRLFVLNVTLLIFWHVRTVSTNSETGDSREAHLREQDGHIPPLYTHLREQDGIYPPCTHTSGRLAGGIPPLYTHPREASRRINHCYTHLREASRKD